MVAGALGVTSCVLANLAGVDVIDMVKGVPGTRAVNRICPVVCP